MFIGSFKFTIDSKSRINIPAKLRQYIKPEAENTFIITRGTERCIDLYPKDEWMELAAKLNHLNLFNKQDATFMRIFLQEATEDKLDKNSRLLIPQSLIQYAGIEKEVFIIGVSKKIEIWNPGIYEEYLKQQETFDNVVEKVMNR